MSNHIIKEEGIGSYFHFENNENIENNFKNELNFDYKIFYTGRHALLHILNEIANSREINKIWFPNYYCQHTLSWIKKSYSNIGIYDTHSFEFSKKIEVTDFAKANDVVLINNYWGLSTMLEEKTSKNSPIVIEDHSHGWLSKACLNSKANYCFVSLRKSLPIPLGGIYWKPNSNIPEINNSFKEDNGFYEIWDLMLKAMSLKSKFIEGDKTVQNETFLSMFYKVEEALNKNTNFAKLSEDHENFIESFIKFDVRKVKDKNLNLLYSKIKDNSHFKIIKRSGYTAFGLLLLFKDENIFNSLKSYLVENKIYPSSLWPDNKISYEWRFFLNVHVDFRYTNNDMVYIITTINKWLNINC